MAIIYTVAADLNATTKRSGDFSTMPNEVDASRLSVIDSPGQPGGHGVFVRAKFSDFDKAEAFYLELVKRSSGSGLVKFFKKDGANKEEMVGRSIV